MNLVANLSNGFQYAWLFWILAFCAIEGYALYLGRKKQMPRWEGGTLSELVWRTFKKQWYTMVVLVLFLFVLGVHFLFAI